MMTRDEVKALADHTRDAHSRDRYTDAGWVQIIKRLDTEGFTLAQVEWVLFSKHMRWAGDAANRNHGVTAADFANYVNVHLVGGFGRLLGDCLKENQPTTETRRALTGADLAGACEGEQVADLIDLAQKVAKGGNMMDFCNMSRRAQAILAEIERRAR